MKAKRASSKTDASLRGRVRQAIEELSNGIVTEETLPDKANAIPAEVTESEAIEQAPDGMVMIILSKSNWTELSEAIHGYRDSGPDGAGWQSDKLSAAANAFAAQFRSHCGGAI